MKKKIRQQIHRLIYKNSKIIDIGCGKGKLLNYLSEKINSGLGIDINKRKVNFANKNKKSNLEFQVMNSNKLNLNKKFDYSIIMFSLHSMNYKTQIKTLNNMKKISKKQIIIDYVLPKNIFQKSIIILDEILARHYDNFKDYKKRGMEKLILTTRLNLDKKIKGSFYSIWICE